MGIIRHAKVRAGVSVYIVYKTPTGVLFFAVGWYGLGDFALAGRGLGWFVTQGVALGWWIDGLSGRF